MAKGSHRLGSKQFFTMSVLAVSVLGLIVVTGAAMKPTNTQSDAAEGCRKKPTLTSDGVNSGANYVTYKFIVSNPNPAGCKSIFYAFYITEPSSAWYREYSLNGGPWISEYNPTGLTAVIKSGALPHSIRARVKPPASAPKKTYSLEANACEAIGSGDGAGPTTNCTTKPATYVIN